MGKTFESIRRPTKDRSCPPPAPDYTATRVRKIRRKAKASQAAFGAILNVGTAKVIAWENGTTKPRGPDARLLDVVERKGLEILF